jgi:hypothetical protein
MSSKRKHEVLQPDHRIMLSSTVEEPDESKEEKEKRITASLERGDRAVEIREAKLYYTAFRRAYDADEGVSAAEHWRLGDEFIAEQKEDKDETSLLTPPAADDWQRFSSRLTEERAAAEAEVERLRAQEGDVEGWGELKDAEAETLRRLAAIRRAIAGEVKDAEGIEAVRAAIARLFEAFVVHKLDADGKLALGPTVLAGEQPEQLRSELVDGDGYLIELRVREDVIDGYDETYGPVLRREPLREAGTKLGTV